MNGKRVQGRSILLAPWLWAAVLLMLGGCTPLVAPPVEPPPAPPGLTGVMLSAPPDALALTREDMPAGFLLAAERRAAPEYVALYLRPSALEAGASGGNLLLSVLTSVGVYTTTADAEAVYLAVSADPTQQTVERVTLSSGSATDIVTESFAGTVQGADAAEAYRIRYRLMDQPVFEYGHRFRVGNVLAYVVVAAIGNPDEPLLLQRDARALVQRQIDRIAAAAE